MRSFKIICGLSTALIMLVALLSAVAAQTQQENIKTFLASEVPEIRLKVNATAEAKPTQNITVALSLSLVREQTSVYINTLNFKIYGFLQGKEKVSIGNIMDKDFPLNTEKWYERNFSIPSQVWDVLYGEISLTYNVTYAVGGGWQIMPYNLTIGFPMTHIENVYLKSLEEQLANLHDVLDGLNQTFKECFGKNLTSDELLSLNQTYWQFMQEYESLKGVKSELDSVRTAMVFLAVVAVFFVATTAYLVLRKPKNYW